MRSAPEKKVHRGGWGTISILIILYYKTKMLHMDLINAIMMKN